jgi:GDPmannose 4,6-dehydratase
VDIPGWETYVEHDDRFLRPAEVDMLIGDATKAKSTLDWAPTVTFGELVQMMVESDLAALTASL